MRALVISVLAMIGVSAGCADQSAAQASQVIEGIEACIAVELDRERGVYADASTADIAEQLVQDGWHTEGQAPDSNDFEVGSSVVWHAENDAIAIGVAPERGCWTMARGAGGALPHVMQYVEQNSATWRLEPAPEGFAPAFFSVEPSSEGRHLLLMASAPGGRLMVMVSSTRWPQ